MNRAVAEAAPGRREKRKLEVRARIEGAAYTLFKRDGIEETSIEQICVAADVARRTFYGHFPHKRALLQALSQTRVWGTADEMLRQIMDEHGSTRARLSAMIDYMGNNIRSYSAVDRALILIMPGSLDEENHLLEVSDSIKDHLTRIFAAGQDVGDTSTDFSAELLAEMVVGTTNTLVTSWAINTDYPIHAKLEEARALFEQIVCLPAR